MKLFNDNQSNIWLIHNPKFHHRIKHINIQYHLVRDHQSQQMVNIFYVNSHDQELQTSSLKHRHVIVLLGFVSFLVFIVFFK
jgi:hypothetical protein